MGGGGAREKKERSTMPIFVCLGVYSALKSPASVRRDEESETSSKRGFVMVIFCQAPPFLFFLLFFFFSVFPFLSLPFSLFCAHGIESEISGEERTFGIRFSRDNASL